MDSILKIGPLGFAVIVFQIVLFYSLIYCSLKVSNKTRPLLRTMSQSLADFTDRFGDEDNVVTRARTRYRRALENIEKVNTQLITSSMLSYTEAVRIFGIKLSFSEFDQLIRSGPSILITLGLLGTFIGLTGNLSELSLILDSARLSPAESLLRASGILGPMATAFISSLVAVSLSLAVWIIGTIKGVNTTVSDLNELMGAYLDQVIQANSKRYSLMRESMERMESYLEEFLATFTDRVGVSIDRAMRDKISEVFESLRESSSAHAKYVSLLEDGSNALQDAGNAFERASLTFAKSSFATDFSESTERFLAAANDVSQKSSSLAISASQLETLLTSLRDSCTQGTHYFVEMREAASAQSQVTLSALEIGRQSLMGLQEATKQLREARLAVGRDARANKELTEYITKGIENVQQTMERVTNSLNATTSRSEEQLLAFTQMLESFKYQVRELAESLKSASERLASKASESNGFTNRWSQ